MNNINDNVIKNFKTKDGNEQREYKLQDIMNMESKMFTD